MDILIIIILIFSILDTIILVNAMRMVPKIPEMARKMADDIFSAKVKELWDHRDDFKAPAEQFIAEILKDMSKGQQTSGSTSIMAGNMEIPLGFLPKKYQGLAQLAMMFLGRNKGGNGGSGGSNPFG
jgi:hypothetical protein